MEQKLIDCGNQLPPLSFNHPWLVAQNLDGTGDQTFYTINDQLRHYKCRIPKLFGRCIRGYFYGWVILSDKNMWSLWNPVTSKIINLPLLKLNDSEIIGQCCLSSSPDDPISILLLMITGKATFVFCQLGLKKDRLRWTRMPYTRQLKGIVGHYNGFLQCLSVCNGKVYALCNNGDVVIQVDIIVKDGEVLIKLLLFGRRPYPSDTRFPISISLLKGSCTELFYIILAFSDVTKKRLDNVYLFKWVMTIMRWEEMVNIKDAVFFVDLSRDCSVYYNHAIGFELGGYIHIRDMMGNMMYTYDVEDKTISRSSMAYPTSHVSLWECRSEGNHGDSRLTYDYKREKDKNGNKDVRSAMDDEVELNESHLLNLPFHLLEVIMDHCIGVEYMSFRGTCKICHLAAPSIQWSNKTSRRLQNYSLVSPWLMVVDKNQGTIDCTDPMSGDRYFMRRSHVLIDCDRILCSRFGWLLFRNEYSILLFFNPFTGDTHNLPPMQHYLDSLCFSAPPTSPDCIVVGFRARDKDARVCIHFVAREQTWHIILLDFGGATPHDFYFPTFCGQDLYVLCDKGEVYVFKNVFKLEDFCFKKVVGANNYEGECFLVMLEQQILLVVVGGKYGEYVKVVKLNDNMKYWEILKCLGRYMIYISDTTCLCFEAKDPKMENKIFFPRMHSRNGKIVFYSLETCRYHRFDGMNIEEIVGVGRENVYPHAWIEPTWSELNLFY